MNSVCPALRVLTLLSKRHMLVIVYTLTKKPMGFNGLQEALAVNTATLTLRLRELEREDIIVKKICETDSRQHYYSLTKRGKKMSALIARFSSV